MSTTFLRFVVLMSPLFLAACGDGWELQKTDKMFPYGNERTAGSGVAYVLAKMMPEKELKLDPVVSEPVMVEEEVMAEEMIEPAPESEPAPVLDAEEVFDDANQKGMKKAEADTLEPRTASYAVLSPEDEPYKAAGTSEGKSDMISEDDAQAALSSSPAAIEPAAGVAMDDITAENFIAQSPKQIDVPRVKIVERSEAEALTGKTYDAAAEHVIMIEPSSGSNATMSDAEEEIISRSDDEVIAPKKDYVGIQSVGAGVLDEIYQNP